MIYRLRYCNKDGIEARVDIQKGSATPIVEIEGTERPFILSYNNDKGNKSGMFLSSSADIEIYETADFNIDNLKTSNETELSVTHYINNVVSWQGFIIPDFFSIEVRSNPVITMTASDRLGTLKNVTLSDLPSMISLRELAVLCLNKTGLTLPLKTMADFSNDGTDNAFFSYYVDSQRIKDIKGRSISCYDILSSILIASNSKLVQRAGEWVIINKLQHEIGSGKIYSSLSSFTNYLENIYNFEEVSIGARRTIMPVAGSVGIYHEHGGRKSHPVNYDYSLGLSGWNSVNGFVATIENRHIIGFLGGTPLIDPERTVKQYLLNYNNWIDDTNNLNTAPYITTDPIQINSPRADRVEVTVDISSTMAEKLSSNTAISFLRYAVILTNGVKTYTLTKAGIFEELDPENISGHSLLLRGGQQSPLLLASPSFSNSDSFKGLFEVGEEDNVNNYSATIRVYGSGNQYVTVNYALIKFSDVSELPRGTMYKTEQGDVFTKSYDIETSIFGDYLLSGLDGYFYRYPNDDTSSIYKDTHTLSSPVWSTPMVPNETGELPLLHHSMRQMRRMFSVAHDLLSAEIEADDFDPLAIFVACEKRYTVVSAQFDFFKSNLSVELEEVAFQSANVRDFIYSYFGDGESGIKSIGGISGGTGGGGSGGGLTPEQLEILSWWKKDPDNPNTIFTEMNAYSKLELSAYGVGTGGGGGGGIIETVYGYGNLGQTFNNANLTDTFNAYTINQINTRLVAVENGSALTVNTTGTGNAITSISKAGSVITASKELTFSLSNHLHSASDITSGTFAIARIPTGTTGTTVALGNHLHTGVYEPVFTKNTAFNKNFGTTAGTVAEGNHTHNYLPLSIGRPTVDLNTLYTSGIAGGGVPQTTNRPVGSHAYSPYMVLQSASDRFVQLWFDSYGGNNIYYRNGTNSVWGDWVTLHHTGNLTSLSQLTDNIGVATHIANTSNPHSVTKTQVGLGNVDNTSDLLKPISTATQTALNLKANLASPTFTGTVTAPTFSGVLSGNATTATTLATARILTVGNTGKTFNGSANVSWSLADIGAAGLSGGMPSSIAAYNPYWVGRDGRTNDMRGAQIPYVINHHTGISLSAHSAYSGIRLWLQGGSPYDHDGTLVAQFSTAINHYVHTAATTITASGAVTAPTFIGALSGNSSSATKLQTARTIWGQSFDGSGDVTGALSGATTIAASISVSAPKVIFNSAGWSIEQVGNELQMKHNNVLKMLFTSTGSIVATEEITAFG